MTCIGIRIQPHLRPRPVWFRSDVRVPARNNILMDDGPLYTSYLLRLWLAGEKSQPQWRASLENSHTGERIGFASLDALFAYLNQQTRLNKDQSIDSKGG